MCVAYGPGKDMFESTKIIGQMQYSKAKELFSAPGQLVTGGNVKFAYQNINMTYRDVTMDNGTVVQTCAAALGYSFAAGTTDGEGASMVCICSTFIYLSTYMLTSNYDLLL